MDYVKSKLTEKNMQFVGNFSRFSKEIHKKSKVNFFWLIINPFNPNPKSTGRIVRDFREESPLQYR